jgi:hypothetical protein
MSIFKIDEVRSLFNDYQNEEISFSKLVEILNEKVYRVQAQKGELITMMDVVRIIDGFLVHNENSPIETKAKLMSTRDYMKQRVLEEAMKIYSSNPPTQ